MKWKLKRLPTGAEWLLMAMIIVGCSSSLTNLAESDMVTLDIQSTNKVSIRNIRVYQTDDELMIRGSLQKYFRSQRRIPGHIDIEIIDSDGALLQEVNVPHFPP